MNDEFEVFLNKVDAFAQGLDLTEQAMLAYLVGDETEDDVAGFNFFEGWPEKVIDIAPRKVTNLTALFSGASGTGITFTGPDGICGVHQTGGNPI